MDWYGSWSAQWWTSVAALGQVGGAIATFLAVVVALSQAAAATTIKVGVRVAWSYPTYGPEIGPPLITVTATNEGIPPARLTSTGMLMPNGRQLVFVEQTQNVLPLTLQSSDPVQYHVPDLELVAALRAQGFTARVHGRFYFSDSTDRRHWGECTINVDD